MIGGMHSASAGVSHFAFLSGALLPLAGEPLDGRPYPEGVAVIVTLLAVAAAVSIALRIQRQHGNRNR